MFWFCIVTGTSKYGIWDSQVSGKSLLWNTEFGRSHWQTILLLCVLVRRGIIRKSHIKPLQLCYIKSGDNLIENVILCRMLIAYFFSIKPSHQRDSSSCEKASCHWCSQTSLSTKLSMCCLASKTFCFLPPPLVFSSFLLHYGIWNIVFWWGWSKDWIFDTAISV